MDFKAQIDKLEGNKNWPMWRRQIKLLLQLKDVKDVVTGDVFAPAAPEKDAAPGVVEEYRAKLNKFNKADALAQLILMENMNDTNIELTFSYATSKEVWDKLISVYEQSSGQRLDRLMEQFFKYEKDATEDITTHIAHLQWIFCELNDELQRVTESPLPELLLMGKIMSTLPKEYLEFKCEWESVPITDRTINLLTERLRLIEMRLPVYQNSSEAFVVKNEAKNPKQKPKSKQKFKCYKCNKVGHFARDCNGNANGYQRDIGYAGYAFVCDNGV